MPCLKYSRLVEEKTMMETRTSIRELSLGSVATIVGYDKAYGGYIGRLTALGLTPDLKFVVISKIIQQNSVVILLSDRIIQLSKPEADALCVEEINEEKEIKKNEG